VCVCVRACVFMFVFVCLCALGLSARVSVRAVPWACSWSNSKPDPRHLNVRLATDVHPCGVQVGHIAVQGCSGRAARAFAVPDVVGRIADVAGSPREAQQGLRPEINGNFVPFTCNVARGSAVHA
jgi:hypothetical protein